LWKPFLEWQDKRGANRQNADHHNQDYTRGQQSPSGAHEAGEQQGDSGKSKHDKQIGRNGKIAQYLGEDEEHETTNKKFNGFQSYTLAF
jgi:hypothetical protein